MRILFLLLILSSKLYATEIHIVGDDNYLPIIGLIEGKPSGILVDRLNKISVITGLKFNITLYPWARAMNMAQKNDVAIVGISKNADREKNFDYSSPLYLDSILIVVKKGKEFKYNRLEDLKGKSIGAQLGASLGNEFDIFSAQNKLNIERDSSRESRLLKILYQRIDLALIGNGIEGFNQILESNPNLKKSRDQFSILEKTLNDDKLYLAFDKKLFKTAELKKLNEAIKKLGFDK